MSVYRPYLYTLLAVVILPIIILLGVWVWIIFQENPLQYSFVKNGAWPIACSTRGCLTTSAWNDQLQIGDAFAHIVNTPELTPEMALTTVIRKHLSIYATVKSSATLADAKRYREQILNLKQKELVEDALNITPEQYDEKVVLPFLRQEALKQERKVESAQELYSLLSQERFVLILNTHYKWDRQTGSAEKR